jgi:hypothetical protein
VARRFLETLSLFLSEVPRASCVNCSSMSVVTYSWARQRVHKAQKQAFEVYPGHVRSQRRRQQISEFVGSSFDFQGHNAPMVSPNV